MKPGSRPSEASSIRLRWRCLRAWNGAENTSTRQTTQASVVEIGCCSRNLSASSMKTFLNAAKAAPRMMPARRVGGSQRISQVPSPDMPRTSDEAGEQQRQRGHRLEALYRIRIAGDHEGQHQRQGRRVPARRIRLAEGMQRGDDEEAVEQRAGHRLLEVHAEIGFEHGHQGQPGRGRDEHALQELGPEQARVQERQAKRERTPSPAI